MSYQFQPDRMYLMPTHFGPSISPRQGPDGQRFTYVDAPKNYAIFVNFLSNQEQLAALLPPGFEVAGEPVVTVSLTYMRELPWLAGRGYAMLGVTFPATYRGAQDTVTGDFMTILWENMAEPIITGREELGFSKVYCDLPEPMTYDGTTHCIATWQGFKFLDIEVSNLRQPNQEEVAALMSSRKGEGVLHYKYIPQTGVWGTSEVAYATLTPSSASHQKPTKIQLGEGRIQFHQARWEDMPTQYMIVNAFHALEIVEYRGAMIMESVGGMEGREQRILQ